jgi:hypothetical protein
MQRGPVPAMVRAQPEQLARWTGASPIGGPERKEDKQKQQRAMAESLHRKAIINVSAASTPFAIDDPIKGYEHAAEATEHQPVLLSGLFVLDRAAPPRNQRTVTARRRAAAARVP